MAMSEATCKKAPRGWNCTRDKGHDGPCAAVKVPWHQRLVQGIGEEIGAWFTEWQ